MSGFSKTDLRYWMGRVKQRTVRGKLLTDYSVRIYFTDAHGDREHHLFSLGTPNKKTAAQKALMIFMHLNVKGWKETLVEFKGAAAVIEDATVGEWIEHARKVATVRKETFDGNANALRHITAKIAKIPSPIERVKRGRKTVLRDQSCNPRSDVFKDWKKKVEAVKLSTLTAAKVNQYVRDFVRERGVNAVEERTAKNSVASKIAHARSLFSQAIVEALHELGEVQIPSTLPFAGVKPPRVSRSAMRYHSTIDVQKVFSSACADLDTESFKAFVLAVVCGLRRNEIDKLLWSQVDFRNSSIILADTEHIRLKSAASSGLVPFDDEVGALLRGWKAAASSEFVLDSDHRKNGLGRYRCNKLFISLCGWLRENGVDAKKPIHELRKEAGKIITESHGIYAASRFLRHANVSTTAAYYADDTRRITTGLGALVSGKVEKADFAASEPIEKKAQQA